MKKLIKQSLNYFGIIILVAATIIFGCRCTTAKPDPLAGFHADFETLNQSIVNDYQNYINNLSPEEKKYLGPFPASFFEDGNEQHAVKIRIGMDNIVWEHVLIYNKDNARIKTIKYVRGHYGS